MIFGIEVTGGTPVPLCLLRWVRGDWKVRAPWSGVEGGGGGWGAWGRESAGVFAASPFEVEEAELFRVDAAGAALFVHEDDAVAADLGEFGEEGGTCAAGPETVALAGEGFAADAFVLEPFFVAFDGVFDFLEVEVSGAEATGFLHGVADAAVFFETGVAFEAFEFAAVVVEDDDGGEAADLEVFLEAFDGGHACIGEAWGANADGFEDGGEDEVSACEFAEIGLGEEIVDEVDGRAFAVPFASEEDEEGALLGDGGFAGGDGARVPVGLLGEFEGWVVGERFESGRCVGALWGGGIGRIRGDVGSGAESGDDEAGDGRESWHGFAVGGEAEGREVRHLVVDWGRFDGGIGFRDDGLIDLAFRGCFAGDGEHFEGFAGGDGAVFAWEGRFGDRLRRCRPQESGGRHEEQAGERGLHSGGEYRGDGGGATGKLGWWWCGGVRD